MPQPFRKAHEATNQCNTLLDEQKLLIFAFYFLVSSEGRLKMQD